MTDPRNDSLAPSGTPQGDSERAPTIVLTFCWTFGIPGGVGRHIKELARSLAEEGAKVIVITLRTMRYTRFPRPKLPEHFLGYETEEELRPLGVEFIRRDPHPLHWMLDYRPMTKAVREVLEARPVDAVLSFYFEGAQLPALCAEHGVPWGIIATWQSYEDAKRLECERGGLGGILRRRHFESTVMGSHRKAQLIFANSNFTVGELRDVLGVDVSEAQVTYLGVDPKFATVEREERDAVRNLLFFGRIRVEKGTFDLIEALGKLHAEGLTDWTLKVVGTGLKPGLGELVQRLGLDGKVEILPHQNDRELLELLAWGDLAILPSHAESFGLVFAEANCAGLPVVGYQAGSVPEVVLDGETAWLAPLRDIDALAGCIRAAITDPAEARRRGLAGRERVLETFRWDETAKAILAGVRAKSPRRATTGAAEAETAV